MIYRIFVLLAAVFVATELSAADTPTEVTETYRVTGLFQPDRVDDLKLAMKEIPEAVLVSVDYDNAEATFRFEPKQAFGTTNLEQARERLNVKVRGVTSGLFGIKARCTIPRDKLELVEIKIYGLDCKGCSCAVYEAAARIDGVERATASFKDGLLKAWIDSAKTNRAALEDSLKQRRIPLEPAK